jgi:amino acid transporter
MSEHVEKHNQSLQAVTIDQKQPPEVIPSLGWSFLKRLLIGKPLATHDLPHQAINRLVGLAVFASDAISSTAYATEEILLILAFAGLAHFDISIPLAIAITFLLIIVTLSYRQTIYAYPNGGGAYIVSHDNLGSWAALIAGAALLMDYILTVAVSISNGVAQIASAIPALQDHRVELAVGVILIMTVVNLRGVKESGQIFAIPTYFFVLMAFILLGTALVEALSGQLGTVPISPERREEIARHATESLTLFLVLRAFSSGCTALTGIEAISNGIPVFKSPKSKNAASTLIAMSSLLIFIFMGFTLLANRVQVLPLHDETVISQMARAVYGTNLMYYLTLAGTALILLMAANTSYADFPRLAALVARDGYLPRQLTHLGTRLVFSRGIVVLGGFALLLVVFFKAQTSALIPLYAIGVFMSFTLSQSGMVIHAWRSSKVKPGEEIKTEATTLEYDPHWIRHMALSGFGAIATGIVMIVFTVTKFTTGAWFIVILIPVLVFCFYQIRQHYRNVAVLLSGASKRPKQYNGPVTNLILVDDVHAGTLRLVNYAETLNLPWKAIHIELNSEKSAIVRKKWEERVVNVLGQRDLIIVESPYRQLIQPIRQYVEQELAKHPDSFINVIMGHLVMDTPWEQVLHQNSALIFNLALQQLDRVAVINVPYQIHHLHHHDDEHSEVHQQRGYHVHETSDGINNADPSST